MTVLTPALLAAPERRVTRLVAQGLLGDVRKARKRLGRGGDPEALHDFRVALRRLRSWLRAYRPALRDSVRGRTLRALGTIADVTNGARDAEVALSWLAAQRGLTVRAQPGLRHLATHLRREQQRFTRRLGPYLGEDFTKLLRRLDAELSHYRVEVTSHAPAALEPMSGAVARIIREHAERFEAAVRKVSSEDDEAAAHTARIAGKRLRYLLEPLAADLRAADVVRQLARLQDALGALHDAHVLGQRIARERDALSRRPTAKPAARSAEKPPPEDPRPGLYALAGRARVDGKAAYAAFRKEWSDNGEAILVSVAQIAEDVGRT